MMSIEEPVHICLSTTEKIASKLTPLITAHNKLVSSKAQQLLDTGMIGQVTIYNSSDEEIERELIPLMYVEWEYAKVVINLLALMDVGLHDLERLYELPYGEERLKIIIGDGSFSHSINQFIDSGNPKLIEILMNNLDQSDGWYDDYLSQELVTADRLKFVLKHKGFRSCLRPKHFEHHIQRDSVDTDEVNLLENEEFINLLANEYRKDPAWLEVSAVLKRAKQKSTK